jgi:hypothetical protein
MGVRALATRWLSSATAPPHTGMDARMRRRCSLRYVRVCRYDSPACVAWGTRASLTGSDQVGLPEPNRRCSTCTAMVPRDGPFKATRRTCGPAHMTPRQTVRSSVWGRSRGRREDHVAVARSKQLLSAAYCGRAAGCYTRFVPTPSRRGLKLKGGTGMLCCGVRYQRWAV